MLLTRLCRGMSSGKFKLVEMGAPPVCTWKASAPNGWKVSELAQKKRKARRCLPAGNSRSQLPVNWSSVNLPGLVTASDTGVRQGVPAGTLVGNGYRNPPAPAPNWLLLTFSRLNATVSTLGTPQSASIAATDCLSLSGTYGMLGVLMNVPGDAPLRCREPW